MAREDGATSVRRNTAAGGGGGAVSGGQVLKKGPWTAAEDAILMEYVKKHGEGNWNAVQRNSGLMRCGKSCRLRWANHLRANLKKGAFTPHEEAQIIELHSKFGNKWARMALHLHGRTDNEIKNYWNTRLKRRLRAGLPIYPVNFQNHHRRHHEQPLHNQTSPFSSSNHGNSISPMLFEPFYVQNSKSQFKIIHSNTQFTNSWFFDPSSLQSNNDTNRIPKTEPSFIEEVTPQNSGGLLEDVLGKSRALIISPHDHKGKDKIAQHDYSIMEDPQHVTLESVFEQNKTLLDDSCSAQSSIEIGVKSHSDVIDGLNVIDDDFSSWLDLPTGSLQDWYGGSEDGSNRNVNHVENSCSPVATDDRDQDQDQDHDWTMGSCCWNNMPGFS